MQNCSKIYKFYRDKISIDILTLIYFFNPCNITYYMYLDRQKLINLIKGKFYATPFR